MNGMNDIRIQIRLNLRTKHVKHFKEIFEISLKFTSLKRW